MARRQGASRLRLSLDTSALSLARTRWLGLGRQGTLAAIVGADAAPLRLPGRAAYEAFGRLGRRHPLALEYRSLLGDTPIVATTSAMVRQAGELARRYRAHNREPDRPGRFYADMLIAATCLEDSDGGVLATVNWRGFHFVEDLAVVDLRPAVAARVPLLAPGLRPVVGPQRPLPACCRVLVSAGVLAPDP